MQRGRRAPCRLRTESKDCDYRFIIHDDRSNCSAFYNTKGAPAVAGAPFVRRHGRLGLLLLLLLLLVLRNRHRGGPFDEFDGDFLFGALGPHDQPDAVAGLLGPDVVVEGFEVRKRFTVGLEPL